jgi:hypothetical protein
MEERLAFSRACLSSGIGSTKTGQRAENLHRPAQIILIYDRKGLVTAGAVVSQVGPQGPPAPVASLRAKGAPLRGRVPPMDYLDNPRRHSETPRADRTSANSYGFWPAFTRGLAVVLSAIIEVCCGSVASHSLRIDKADPRKFAHALGDRDCRRSWRLYW